MSAAGHVTALRGTAPALRRAEPDAGSRTPHVLRPSGPLLPLVFARGGAFFCLATFGALHWMAMLDPTATGRAWSAVGAGLLALAGLLAAARLRGVLRWLVVAGTVLVTIALAFMAAGVPAELLRPGNWDALASGIERGISALPGARVPYRGIDNWTRIVIPLGGTMLTVLAALTAFWPRRATTGFPFAALVLLVTLYAVPAVALDFDGEFLRGALLAVLVVAFLRLERLRLTEAGAAATLAAGMAIAALIIAPALDSDTPWWDYETWALSTASSKSTTFSWDHDYGPLDWPRDGREMLRVKAKRAAYWKAQNLDIFDGDRWIQAQSGTRESIENWLPDDPAIRDRFTQQIEVSVRNLRTRTFVTAGIAVDAPEMPNRAAIPNGPPGIWASSRTLRRGDTYTVDVYTPKPTEREMRSAGSFYDRNLDGYRMLELGEVPGQNSGAPPGWPSAIVRFPQWDLRNTAPDAYRPGFGTVESAPRNADRVLARSDLSRTWRLAQRLKQGAQDPLDYVQSVEAYLGRGFTYTEAPPTASETLDGFLFETKSGYCQQYSGAMALLLRMGGIPARVATGFTSGSYDRKAKEYVRARPRRPLVGRGVDPRLRLGHLRPDALGRPAALAELRPRRRRHRRRARPRRQRDRPAHRPGRRGAPAVRALRRPRAAGAARARRRHRTPTCTAAAARPRCPSSSARCAAPAATPARARRCRGSRRRSPARPTPPATCGRCATSATTAAASRRRAPSGAACGASWGGAEGCSGACAHGGRYRRDGPPSRRTLDAHG